MFLEKSRIRCGFSLLKYIEMLVIDYKNRHKKSSYFFII